MADYAIHDTTLEAIADTIRKKDGTQALIDPADYSDRINLMGMLEEKTASSASVCSFSDGADRVPVKNWLVTLPASLDGYSEVNGYKANTNFYDDKHLNVGLPATAIGSSIDTINTTATRYTYNGFSSPRSNIAIKGSRNDTSIVGACLFFGYSGGFLTEYRSINPFGSSAVVIDCSGFDYVRISIGAASGYQAPTDMTAYGYMSAEYGTTFTEYVPADTKQHTVSLGRTIYGGTADIVTGEGEDENGNAYTFTPITPTPETALGVNNFWANEGDTEVTYRSSGTVTPVQPVLVSKTITENGVFSAEDDDADGYDVVTVNVSGGDVPFVPQFTETKIADNTAHAASFTLTEDYANFDMVKIVWYESASSSGFLYTTPDILDEIFSVGVGKLCINKPSTNYYACYTKNGLTWTRSNQHIIDVHEIYGVTFSNCTMQATDLYKRGASTTTKYAVSSQTSLKDFDLFMMASIHATDGSETMPTTWLYQYPPENMSEAFSCPVPTVLQEYNANDEAFVISEYGMTAARFFMVQGITFTQTPSLLSMSPAPVSQEESEEEEDEQNESD